MINLIVLEELKKNLQLGRKTVSAMYDMGSQRARGLDDQLIVFEKNLKDILKEPEKDSCQGDLLKLDRTVEEWIENNLGPAIPGVKQSKIPEF